MFSHHFCVQKITQDDIEEHFELVDAEDNHPSSESSSSDDEEDEDEDNDMEEAKNQKQSKQSQQRTTGPKLYEVKVTTRNAYPHLIDVWLDIYIHLIQPTNSNKQTQNKCIRQQITDIS